jgi:hypothetical protein
MEKDAFNFSGDVKKFRESEKIINFTKENVSDGKALGR